MEKKNSQSENPKEVMGFSDMRAKFQTWVLGLSSSVQKKYIAFAAVAIIVLPTVASIFKMVRPLEVALSFPAGIALFLLGTAIFAIVEEKNPGSINLKARLSASQRLKWSIIGGIVALALIVSASTFIPYAVGGVIVLATALGIYSFIQRTPEEIAYYDAGVLDPRDEAIIMRSEERMNNTKKKKSKKEVSEDE